MTEQPTPEVRIPEQPDPQVPTGRSTGQPSAQRQLADLAELVATGPVDLGAYTQAEMAVVLGDLPALAGVDDEVLAEAVRSLAARGEGGGGCITGAFGRCATFDRRALAAAGEPDGSVARV